MDENQYIESPQLAQDIADKLKALHKGELSVSDIEDLVSSSRELYERLVVLRFLAYEKNDFVQKSEDSVETKLHEDVAEAEESEEFIEDNASQEEVSVDLSFSFNLTEESEPEKESVEVEFNPFSLGQTTAEDSTTVEPTDDGSAEKKIEPEVQKEEVTLPTQVEAEVSEPQKSSTVEVTKQTVTITQETSENKTTVDIEKNSVTLNEKFANRVTLQETIALKHEKAAITDLKKAIGINQRFAFINNLFKGKAEEFNSAIDKLNNLQDTLEAFEFVQRELARKYDWDFELPVVQEFLELVERRYMA
ncbi:MAG: hypothetical protein ACXITV_13150 [Luteibaculaceae bacterium]